MADLGVGAVGWVESLRAPDEGLEFGFESREIALSHLDVVQLGREQLADVGAGGETLAAQFQDGGDLEQGEPSPCPLRMNWSRVRVAAS